MRILHHLDSAELMSCASGSQPEAIAAVISTHLSLCPQCRQELKTHSLIGETLFQSLKDEELLSPAPTPSSPNFQSPVSSPPHTRTLNTSLELILSGQSTKLSWREITPGILDLPLSLSNLRKGSIKFLKCKPNMHLTELEKTEAQIMIVLEGSLKGDTNNYSCGDILHILNHKSSFVSDATKGCICLLASEKNMNIQHLLS